MSTSINNNNNTSGYVAPSSLIQSGKSPRVNSGTDSDGDGDGGGRRVHKGHGGGQMQQAMMQALQSLGLAVPGQPQVTSSPSD